MNFYKFICILAFVVLIISLACIGVALTTSSSDVVFPPNIASCPDFYVKDKDGVCNATFQLGSDDEDCTSKSFDVSGDGFSNPGMGPTSGICAKKTWAENCGVNWDGITNNNEVCYKTISST